MSISQSLPFSMVKLMLTHCLRHHQHNGKLKIDIGIRVLRERKSIRIFRDLAD